MRPFGMAPWMLFLLLLLLLSSTMAVEFSPKPRDRLCALQEMLDCLQFEGPTTKCCDAALLSQDCYCRNRLLYRYDAKVNAAFQRLYYLCSIHEHCPGMIV
ncbi:hypothetical protein M569_13917 [Genlisea aurea]|uniref:Bifunctional inhibitor/plant lipid transfer protein/seed storage helical domain-containing protein n=1 Tax=Genlisea aurea TaxID=192259 RepID=S8C298_9LAMI|nr:hypothetical protein M569_13917 [Genlisea aurea]